MKCQFCEREIKNAGSLKAHEMSCKENPNRVKHKHSPNAGWTKGKPSPLKGRKIGRNKIWDEKYPDTDIFSEQSSYPRHSLKARIRERNLIDYRCAICNIEPVWQGKPMPLILDHKNGVNNDNRLDNLRFVCSNCDSQLETYKSRNRKVKQIGDCSGLENRRA